jgi:hypothetical protein
MRAALAIVCVMTSACSSTDDPCTAGNGCVTWSWTFVDSSGRAGAGPPEVTELYLGAEAMFRNEGGGDPYYYVPAGSTMTNDCSAGEASFLLTSAADRSTLTVMSQLAAGHRYTSVTRNVRVEATDRVELDAMIRNDLGYLGYSWTLISDSTGMAGTCPYGAAVILIATAVEGAVQERRASLCEGSNHGFSAGMTPGVYSVMLVLEDSTHHVLAQSQVWTSEVVAHTEVELEPVVLHLP